jgi:hypothetical protein
MDAKNFFPTKIPEENHPEEKLASVSSQNGVTGPMR